MTLFTKSKKWLAIYFIPREKIGFDNLTATRETIVKESNNIEDLFDAVVIINKKRKILSVDENGVVTYDGVGNDDATIYGAVLTKRKNGLAMVASKDGENWKVVGFVMKIYINNILIKAEILPSNTPTLDETLETFSFDLISNDNPLPFAPMQEVRIDFLSDESEVVRFVLTSDNVDIFSTNPLRYKHNMVCTQYDRKLSKHLVRNTVITQPANPKKESFNSAYFGFYFLFI